jgi:hypothetical protein
MFTVRPTLHVASISLSRLDAHAATVSSLSPEDPHLQSLDGPGKSSLDDPRNSLRRNPSSFRRERGEDDHLIKTLRQATVEGGHCLLQVEMLNAFSSPLEACVERLTDEGGKYWGIRWGIR